MIYWHTLVAFDEVLVAALLGDFLQEPRFERFDPTLGAKDRPAANDRVLTPLLRLFLRNVYQKKCARVES
jgi:hypothetical protein